jgi:hypothetical protein
MAPHKTPHQPIKPSDAQPAQVGGRVPFLTADRHAACEHFAPLVAKIAEASLETWNKDAEIVCANVARGMAALAPHLDPMTKAMPHVDMAEVREIPALSLALAFAAARVFVPASANEIRDRQKTQRKMRRLAIDQLVILRDVEPGLIADPSKVDAILPGTGPIDQANDGVQCVAQFRENAKRIAGKHPFSDAWLEQLAADSNWLLSQIRRAGAVVDPGDANPDALVRDRLYTELVRRWGQAKKIAVEVWGWKDVDANFPALGSRIVVRADEEEEPEAQPAPVPAADPAKKTEPAGGKG